MTEIEAYLAIFEVQSFRNQEASFDPSLQHCAQVVPTADRKLAGFIAARIQPGYRRGEKIIRPECVEVFVFTQTNEGDHKK